MSQIYLVQQYPYEDWETIAHFDNVEEANILCQKLEIYGMDEMSVKWFYSFLTNRSQKIMD